MFHVKHKDAKMFILASQRHEMIRRVELWECDNGPSRFTKSIREKLEYPYVSLTDSEKHVLACAVIVTGTDMLLRKIDEL